jgi:hypothetical protein
LLATIGELLEDELMSAVPGELRHKVRVAANLIQIIKREWQLGADQKSREQAALRDLVGGTDAELGELRSALDDMLRPDRDTPPDFDVRAWHTLVYITRGELSIVKPGHDNWQGE